MDLVNLSWHIGAVAFGLWAAWLVHDLRREHKEFLEAALPCALTTEEEVSRSRFLRACRLLIRTGLRPHLGSEPKVAWLLQRAGEGAKLKAQDAREALSHLHGLQEIFGASAQGQKGSSVTHSDPERSWGFEVALVSGEMASVLTPEELVSRLETLKTGGTLIFEFVGPATGDNGRVCWKVKQT